MAVNTDNFGFKKPDESDFYDVQDQNGNWDIADQELEKLNSPTFEDYTEDTSVPEAVTAIEALKSKSKIGMLLSNIKAAFKGACLIGHIVNNCVTDNPSLPLSAAQGKVLMDYYTKLYSDKGKAVYSSDLLDGNTTGAFIWYNGATANTPYKAGLTSATEGVCLKMEDLTGYLSIYAFVKGGSEIFVYAKNPTTVGKWEKMI